MSTSLPKTVAQRLVPFAGGFTKRLKTRLDEEGKVATRALKNSLQTVVLDQGPVVLLQGWALDYWRYVDQGRRPGKMPPEKPILRWIEVKGLGAGLTKSGLRSLAFLIRRKIGREGTKGTNLFTEEIAGLEERVEKLAGGELADVMSNKIFEVMQPKQVKPQFKGI